MEDFSSALFPRGRPGSAPERTPPLGELRMDQDFTHEPVMADVVVDLFAPVPAGVLVDATVGGGGHAAALLSSRPDLGRARSRP